MRADPAGDQGLGSAVPRRHHVGRARLGVDDLGTLVASPGGQQPARLGSRGHRDAQQHLGVLVGLRARHADDAPPGRPTGAAYRQQSAGQTWLGPPKRPSAADGSASPAIGLSGPVLSGPGLSGPGLSGPGLSGRARRSLTSSVTMEANLGWLPGVVARAKARPSDSAACLASTSRSCRTSMWSDTNPTGITTTAFVPDLASSPRWSQTSGASHGWDGGPLRLW